MSDQELNELRDKIDILTEHLNNDNKNGWLKMVFGTLAVFLIMLIFYGGIFYRDVQILKDNSIQKHEWLDNEAKTNATYNKVFDIPSEYTTRGQQLYTD